MSTEGLFNVERGNGGDVVRATILTATATKKGGVYILPNSTTFSPDGINALRERFKDICCRKGDRSLICSPPTALALVIAGIIPDKSFTNNVKVNVLGIGEGFLFPDVPVPDGPNQKAVTVTVINITDAKLRKLVKDDPRFKRFSWKK